MPPTGIIMTTRHNIVHIAAGPYVNMLADMTPQCIAEQVTLFNAHLLARIHPVELINYFFPKSYHGSKEPTPFLKVGNALYDVSMHGMCGTRDW